MPAPLQTTQATTAAQHTASALLVMQSRALSHGDFNAAAVSAVSDLALLLQPAWKAARFVLNAPELQGQRAKAVGLSALGSVALMLVLFAVPLPYRTQAPGVVWLSDEAMVRLGTDGFAEEYLAVDGEEVAAGQAVMRLSNDVLQADAQRAQATLTRVEVERAASFDLDAVRAGVANDALVRAQAEWASLQQRTEQLTVRAATAGRVVINPGTNVVGRYLAQGQLVAHVLSAEAALVKVMVRNEDIAQVRLSTETNTPFAPRIKLELAHVPGTDGAARWVACVPQASGNLPSAALGENSGGSIATDSTDTSGRTRMRNRARRIDRQLRGRCARHGDPGSAQAMVALDDVLLTSLAPAWLRRGLAASAREGRVPAWLSAPRFGPHPTGWLRRRSRRTAGCCACKTASSATCAVLPGCANEKDCQERDQKADKPIARTPRQATKALPNRPTAV